MARKQSPGDTPAAKRLRQLRVEHEVVEYSPDLESGAAVAGHLGEDPARILKTLVVQRPPCADNPGWHSCRPTRSSTSSDSLLPPA
ncbi:MAG: hypothetical protein U5Q44_09275 [Dehalococcoidia bacterium]|nr:hypothetical protein [Dehalococcoidia bacterium]